MATTTLLCKQCNYENEPERVYCHNCGAKLDRSLLPPEATKREDPVVVQDRLRRMTNPRRGLMRARIKTLIYCLLISAVLAFVIQLARPPEGLPTVTREQSLDAPMIIDDLQTSVEAGGSKRASYTAQQVNQFLGYSIKGKADSVLGIPVKFERAFVQMEEGRVRVYMEQSIFGYSLFANGLYAVEIRDGKLVSKCQGGGIGRVNLPSATGPVLDGILSPLWKATSRDQKLLAKLQRIAFHKDAVEMETKPEPQP